LEAPNTTMNLCTTNIELRVWPRGSKKFKSNKFNLGIGREIKFPFVN
jgi:hypothetical protein